MKPNQKDKAGQPVDNKLNQPSVQNVKKADINPEQPKAIQDNHYGSKQNKQQPSKPMNLDAKKITDAPVMKEPKEQAIKGEPKNEEAPERKGIVTASKQK